MISNTKKFNGTPQKTLCFRTDHDRYRMMADSALTSMFSLVQQTGEPRY